MYRVLTVSREFGSGGAEVAKHIARLLDWRLLDNNLVMEIARAAKIEPGLARRFDEQVDSWLHRISRAALWHGAFEGIARPAEGEVFDAATEAALATTLIREAHQQGSCVIVGRGAQCVLQNDVDVFHLFVYAPWTQKMARVARRLPPESSIEERIRATDRIRCEYIRRHFGAIWTDPHLYDLMISTSIGVEAAAGAVVGTMRLAGGVEGEHE